MLVLKSRFPSFEQGMCKIYYEQPYDHMSHDLGAVTIFRFSELGLVLGLG